MKRSQIVFWCAACLLFHEGCVRPSEPPIRLTGTPIRVAGTPDPGGNHIDRIESGDVGVFVGPSASRVKVRAAKNVDQAGSFGFIGVFADVRSDSDTLDGTLMLRYPPKQLGAVRENTLRLFRWDERASRYRVVRYSSVNLRKDYVWGGITRPGRYAIIGMNRHPFISPMLSGFCGLAPVLSRVNDQLGRRIRDNLCWEIQCGSDAFFIDRQTSMEMAREEGFGPATFGGGGLPFGGSLCDQCFGLPLGPIPECDLIEPPPGRRGALEIAVLVDVSGSLSETIFEVARNGLATVLEDPAVFPADGSITLTVILFGQLGPDIIEVVVNRERIDSPATAAMLVSQIRGLPWSGGGGTPLAAAIDTAVSTIQPLAHSAVAGIVLLTDGIAANASVAADEAMSLGFDEIDAIAMGAYNLPYLQDLVRPVPDTPGPTPSPGFVVTGLSETAVASALGSVLETLRSQTALLGP